MWAEAISNERWELKEEIKIWKICLTDLCSKRLHVKQRDWAKMQTCKPPKWMNFDMEKKIDWWEIWFNESKENSRSQKGIKGKKAKEGYM